MACLLCYNPATSDFDTSHVSAPELAKFFEDSGSPTVMQSNSSAVLENWSKVVSGIPDPNIQYIKRCSIDGHEVSYELKADMINILYTLAVVFQQPEDVKKELLSYRASIRNDDSGVRELESFVTRFLTSLAYDKTLLKSVSIRNFDFGSFAASGAFFMEMCLFYNEAVYMKVDIRSRHAQASWGSARQLDVSARIHEKFITNGLGKLDSRNLLVNSVGKILVDKFRAICSRTGDIAGFFFDDFRERLVAVLESDEPLDQIIYEILLGRHCRAFPNSSTSRRYFAFIDTLRPYVCNKNYRRNLEVTYLLANMEAYFLPSFNEDSAMDLKKWSLILLSGLDSPALSQFTKCKHSEPKRLFNYIHLYNIMQDDAENTLIRALCPNFLYYYVTELDKKKFQGRINPAFNGAKNSNLFNTRDTNSRSGLSILFEIFLKYKHEKGLQLLRPCYPKECNSKELRVWMGVFTYFYAKKYVPEAVYLLPFVCRSIDNAAEEEFNAAEEGYYFAKLSRKAHESFIEQLVLESQNNSTNLKSLLKIYLYTAGGTPSEEIVALFEEAPVDNTTAAGSLIDSNL